MTFNRRTIQAGYTIAAFLGVSSIFDTLRPFTPPDPSDPRWRFIVIGNLSSTLIMPLLALFIALGCAHFSASARIRRVVAGIAAAFAIVIVALLATFIADYYRLQPTLAVGMRHTAATVTSIADVKYVLNLLGFCGVAYAGFASSGVAATATSAADARSIG